MLVANGARPERATANALLDVLLGAQIEYVGSREERAPAMRAAIDRLRAQGRKPFEIPLGASTPLGALGFASAVVELLEQVAGARRDRARDVVRGHPGRSRRRVRPPRRPHDRDRRERRRSRRRRDAQGAGPRRAHRRAAGGRPRGARAGRPIEVDDAFVGDGYGIPTTASREALSLAARTEALFLDPTYTAKAMAGLIARVRDGRLGRDATVLFWHTGGQPALFA